MSTETAIEWTHRRHPATGVIHPGGTANYWIGCTPCDEACALCYAWGLDDQRFSKTLGEATPANPIPHFGKGRPRWQVQGVHATMRKLDRMAVKAGIPLAAFTNSLADFFDEEVPDAWREDAMETIIACRNVDTMILTKRAAKMREWMDDYLMSPLPNVWLGVTAATKKGVIDRVPFLRKTQAAKRFISAEPLLEDIAPELNHELAQGGIDLVIVGGESEDFRNHPGRKKGARPMAPDWVLAIQQICWLHNVPFFFKQWGAWAPAYELDHDPQAQAMCLTGNVGKHVFDFGEAGRRSVYRVGKHRAGCRLDGKIFHEMPKLRSITGKAAGQEFTLEL